MQTWGRYTVFSCIERTHLTEVHDAYLPIANDLVRRVHIRRPTAVPEAPRALVQHARRAVQMCHGRISPILELSYSGDVPLVVSEGLSGRALATLMAQSRGRELGFDPQAALFIAIGILEGLSHAHQHTDPSGRLLGLVHRDVRPETVWIGFDGSVRLGGFGFAVDTTTTPEPLPPWIDPPYWSPEMVAGEPLDHRSDVFSVGAILFELLTGVPVYEGTSAEERWSSAQHRRVRQLVQVAAQLPAELSRRVDAALSPDPEERPPSAGVFRDELARLLHRGEPAYGSARLASAVAMVLGEAAADDRSRALAAYHYLSHLEPGLVIRAPASTLPATPPPAPPARSGRGEPEGAPSEEALAPRSESSWSDTENFPALHYQESDSFDAFESHPAPRGAQAEFDVPTEVGERSVSVVPPSPPSEPAYTPPRIEAPDPAAAMADAFSADSSGARARARTADARSNRRRISIALAVAVIVGAGVLALAPELRRQVSSVARLLVLGRKPGGTLVVESIPPGARVRLDGDDTGERTPVTMHELESEVTHRIELALGDDLVKSTTVAIQAHRKRTLRIVFSRAITSVRVQTTPSEADVYVGGRAVKLSPADLILKTGEPTVIKVEKAGYVPKTWTVEPKPGEALNLTHTFELTDGMREAAVEQTEALRAAGIDAGPGR